MLLTPCNSKADPQGRELTVHGSSLFPVACYHDDLANEIIPWHWHREWEAFVVAVCIPSVFIPA